MRPSMTPPEDLRLRFTKEAESDRALGHERLQLFVDNITDYAMYTLDFAGHVASWNRGAERIKGYSKEEIIGKYFSCFFPDEDVRLGKPAALLKAAAGQGRFEEQGWRVRKDGSRFWAHTVLLVLKNGQDELRGFAQITKDMTESLAAETELREKTQALERSNSELAHFAHTAAHELQEPLRKIIAFGNLLQKNQPPGSLTNSSIDFLERIKNASQRMQLLINEILELSKITANTRPLEPVDLNQLFHEITTDIAGSLRDTETPMETILQEGATLIVGNLPVVRGDPTQMRQLFNNLLSNAFKFRKNNERLRIRVLSHARSDGFIDILIQDNGIGFDEKFLGNIFKPFHRLHPRGTYPGTGLGLAFCERILLRHGGKITANSSPEVGSTFIVTLPAS